MTFTERDPQSMSPAERKVELAALLAAGYVRLLATRNGLALDRLDERACPPVDERVRRGALAATSASEEVE